MNELPAGRRKARFNPSMMTRLGLPLLAVSSVLTMPTANAAGWVNTLTQAMPSSLLTQPAALDASTPLRLTVALKIQNKSVLDQMAIAVNTPGNAQYGQFLTPAQFNQQFSPTAAQAQAVVDYLQQMGFNNIQVSDNRLSITAEGTAGAAQTAFNTSIVQFVLDGLTEFANTTAPQVPAEFDGLIASVIGLQSTGRMQTQIVHQDRAKAAAAWAARRDTVSLASASSSSGSSSSSSSSSSSGGSSGGSSSSSSSGGVLSFVLPPAQTPTSIRVAYDADSVPTGASTSVGVLGWGDMSTVVNDLRIAEKMYNLPQVPLSNVIIGEPTTSTSDLDEWDLDSQAVNAMAFDLKQIIMYSVYAPTDSDLAAGVNKIVQDNQVKAVNMSFSACEEFDYLDGTMASMDQAFEQGVVQGMTFFAATGDGGAACQIIINLGQPGLLGLVGYPASSPWVVSVGGTTLFTNSDGSYSSEIAWIDSGGGMSLFEYSQPWQVPVLIPFSGVIGDADLFLGSGISPRSLPDIAMNADDILSPYDIVVGGSVEAIGGTSEASPLSMGAFARFQSTHGECLGFAAPLLYAEVPPGGVVANVLNDLTSILDALNLPVSLSAFESKPGPEFGSPATGFHDVVLGDNFIYPAWTGWDYTTGLGSFDVAAVNAELPAVSCAAPALSAPSTTTSAASSASGGGAIGPVALLPLLFGTVLRRRRK